MADEIKPLMGSPDSSPTPEKPAPEPISDAGHSGEKSDEPKTFDAEYVKDLRKESAKYRTEARDLQKRLEALENDRKAREEKDLSANQKWEELAKKREQELAELKAALEDERKGALRTRIGMEFRLPQRLIDRLQGATEEELREDAQAWVTELGLNKPVSPEPAPVPIPTEPAVRRQNTAIVPDGQPVGETLEQTRARLYRRQPQDSPLFNPPRP